MEELLFSARLKLKPGPQLKPVLASSILTKESIGGRYIYTIDAIEVNWQDLILDAEVAASLFVLKKVKGSIPAS